MVQTEIVVEVVYALPQEQRLIALSLPSGTTVKEAIGRWRLLEDQPEIDLENLGIFGKRVQPDTVLRHGDRIEIYRMLAADPKEARRRRIS